MEYKFIINMFWHLSRKLNVVKCNIRITSSRKIANVTFRNAVKSDIPQIYMFAEKLAKYQGVYSLQFTINDLEEHISNPRPWYHTYICESKENGITNIVASSSYFQTYAPFCTRTAFLFGFYIAPEWRRKGIGTNILQHHIRLLSEAGIESVYATQYVFNDPSRIATAKNDFIDLTDTQGVHEMLISFKQQTFTKYTCNPSITVRDANIGDCAEISRLFQDSSHHKIAANPVSLNEEKLQKDGFTNRPYFDAIVAIDNTKFDTFGNNVIVGCALYTKALPFFLGKILHLASICVQTEYNDANVDKRLWQELEKIAYANGCHNIRFATWESTPCYKYALNIGARDYVTYDPQNAVHSIGLIIDKPVVKST